jgi:hypothetical protein
VQAPGIGHSPEKTHELYGQKGYAITVGRDGLRVRLPKRGEIDHG